MTLPLIIGSDRRHRREVYLRALGRIEFLLKAGRWRPFSPLRHGSQVVGLQAPTADPAPAVSPGDGSRCAPRKKQE
jgi:hypothetical protein